MSLNLKNIEEETLVKYFKWSCIAECISCVLLFLVAMPIKYTTGNVLLMPFAGIFHGVFFTAYVVLVFVVRKIYRWDDEDVIFALMFAFIPFATLMMHKSPDNNENK